MKVDIYRDAKGEHRWRFKASNGRIIADSAEGYASKGNATKAARRVIVACADHLAFCEACDGIGRVRVPAFEGEVRYEICAVCKGAGMAAL